MNKICPYCYKYADLAGVIPCPGYGITCKTRTKIPRGGCCYSCLRTRKFFNDMILPMKPCSPKCKILYHKMIDEHGHEFLFFQKKNLKNKIKISLF